MVLLTTACVWWFILALTGVIILLRLAVILSDRTKPHGADFCMLFTWITALTMNALITSLNDDLAIIENLSIHSKRAVSQAEMAHIAEIMDYVMKIQYIISLLNVMILWFAKVTLFAVYVPIQSRLKKSLRIFLWLGLAFTVCTFFTAFFMTMFWCGRDLSVNWTVDLLRPDSLCAGTTAEAVVIFTTAATLTTDLILLALGIMIIGSLSIQGRREIIALVFVFLLGLVSVIAVCVRFSFVIDISRNSAKFSRWMAAEAMTALVVCCLPAARTLLRRVPGLKSFGRSHASSATKVGSKESFSKESKSSNVLYREDTRTLTHERSAETERSLDEEAAGAVETQGWRLQG